MLMINEMQMKMFDEAAMRSFEWEMIAHIKGFSPRYCKALGDEKLSVLVRHCIERAKSYGFTNRGPIRLYIELTFLLGGGFEANPRYEDIGAVLRGPGEQTHRADQFMQCHCGIWIKVPGANAAKPCLPECVLR